MFRHEAKLGARVRFFSRPKPAERQGTIRKLFMGDPAQEAIARVAWDDGHIANHVIDHLELVPNDDLPDPADYESYYFEKYGRGNKHP